ncbi:uncharacterized protein [Ptychodera flava]|uniref:uncharacterized protein n=1 Tax=Ptychodera flava TaxID=63121 RepID=UPI00396A93FA
MLQKLAVVMLEAWILLVLSTLSGIGLSLTVAPIDDTDDHFPSFEGDPPPLHHLPPLVSNKPRIVTKEVDDHTVAPSTVGYEAHSTTPKYELKTVGERQKSEEYNKVEGYFYSSVTQKEGYPVVSLHDNSEGVTTFRKKDEKDFTADALKQNGCGAVTVTFAPLLYCLLTTLVAVQQR